jgi:hypothetical protein
MLKHIMTMSIGDNMRFGSTNGQRKYIKLVMEKIYIEYNNMIVSDYEQYHHRVYLEYINL